MDEHKTKVFGSVGKNWAWSTELVDFMVGFCQISREKLMKGCWGVSKD